MLPPSSILRPPPPPPPDPHPIPGLLLSCPSSYICVCERPASHGGCRGRALYGGNGGGVDPESLEKDNDANIHALGDRVGLLRQVHVIAPVVRLLVAYAFEASN